MHSYAGFRTQNTTHAITVADATTTRISRLRSEISAILHGVYMEVYGMLNSRHTHDYGGGTIVPDATCLL